ncbi:hypothetical protein [Streptomyces sp. NPDC059894]|uniref:hypothetical protein n=1 Tax=unclassified Streptomyces TaxID=2593676 RepID=UPI0036557B88
MISLREVRDSDLPVFWEHLSDPAAQHVAAVTRKYHYDREQFDGYRNSFAVHRPSGRW